jgi:DNA-binding MarR family transcriptional regulator
MNADDELGALLERLVNAVSHPRGRALSFLAQAGVTVDQAILLDHALRAPGSNPTALAKRMSLTLPSMSQMIERLVVQGLVRRVEDPHDRRKRTIEPTAKAKKFLERFRSVRIAEFESATSALSNGTRRKLAKAIEEALAELDA